MLPEEAAAVGEDYDNKKSPEAGFHDKVAGAGVPQIPGPVALSRSVGFLYCRRGGGLEHERGQKDAGKVWIHPLWNEGGMGHY